MRYPATLTILLPLTGVTIILYLVMIFGPLALLQDIAGTPALDMRPLGYQPADAATFLDALGAEGRAIYLTRQIPLDLMYPGLLALTLAGWFRRLGRGGAAVAIAASICDYVENGLIVIILLGYPDAPDVYALSAGWATMLKSGLSTIAMTWLLIASGISVSRSRGRRHVRPVQKTASADKERPRYG